MVWLKKGLYTECYVYSTAMLPGPAIPILSQVFVVILENKLDYTEHGSNYDL